MRQQRSKRSSRFSRSSRPRRSRWCSRFSRSTSFSTSYRCCLCSTLSNRLQPRLSNRYRFSLVWLLSPSHRWQQLPPRPRSRFRWFLRQKIQHHANHFLRFRPNLPTLQPKCQILLVDHFRCYANDGYPNRRRRTTHLPM